MTPQTPPGAVWRRRDRLGRALRWILRRRHVLMPLASFMAGCASYFLVERSAAMAQGIAVMVLAGWLWILAEPLLARLLQRVSRGRVSPRLLPLVTQSLHQETLFFALPFIAAATVWTSAQPLFLALVALAALATALDRIYIDRICAHPGRLMLFQAFCAFVAALVVVPLALHRDTTSALDTAAALMLLGLLPGALRWLRDVPARVWPRGALACLLLLAAGWGLRAHVPAVGLEARDMRATSTLDAALEPGPALTRIDVSELRQQGLTAFAAIRAPLGLHQQLIFEWRHDGRVVERIGTDIAGGREAGYRTFTRKQNFPAHPEGRWEIMLRTADGQLLARTELQVEV